MIQSLDYTQNETDLPMFIRAYLRASTDDQDASRARDYLETFVSGYGKAIASCYMENASGSHADRPELIRLLKDA
ncbi:putative resolvase, partial [Pseudomonas amygdali pv. eriobotryae]